MKVLLSIKPEFAEKIFDGTKKYEFRKIIFKRKDVKKVIVYASSPIQQVIGEFEIEGILDGDIDTIWKRTKNSAGITKRYYDEYFLNKSTVFAIKIGLVKKYFPPKQLSEFNVDVAPQSFVYIFDDE